MPTPDDYSNNQPGYRNFTPPPTTPDYWTRSNDRGSAAQHPVDPSNYNSPQATQTAQAPTPPVGPPTPLTPPVPPPAPPNENIDQPTPPTPAEAKPEPAAKPLPNLGAWTPDQAKPWMHVKPIAPQQVPDRPPDTHVGTRPAWNPRPGEAGYGRGPRQPGNYSFGEQLGFALQVGFTGPAAYTAAALGMAESNGNPNAIHYQDGGKPFNSYGLMQINGSNDAVLRANGINGASAAVDPLTSYKAAYVLSKGGTDFSPWSTFKDGSYKAYLDGNARPEASSALVVGPRQQYIPPQGREPHQWGETPTHDWGEPGRMPGAHDIPGIMGGLLPIALTLFAGLAGGGALGAIAAFSGYQNARNRGQTTAAKDAKETFQNKLKETESGLKEELLEAAGIWAQYGNDQNSPGAKAAWWELSSKYQDKQLLAALESDNTGAIEQLFKKRDEAFQTIGKVSAAQTKADEQEKQREEDQKTEAVWGVPGVSAPSAGGAPSGPEKPWENAPSPQTGAPASPPAAGGGPAAGTSPGSAPPAPQPAAAPAPAPSEQPPEQPAPQEPVRRELSPAPPGTPSDTLGPVSVTAPTPQPAAAPAPSPASPRSTFDELVSEGVNGQDIEKFKAGVPKDMLPKLQGAIAQKNAQIDAVQPGPNAAAQLAAIDPNFASYVNGVSHYTAQMPSPRANTGRDFTDRVQAAVKKINPQWNFANYKKQEEFAQSASGNNTQARLTRASTMGEAAANVMKDVKVLQDAGVEVTQDKISEALDRFVNNLGGDPRYMAVANDILAFTQEDQALRTGNPSVTETEAQQALVAGHVFLGSIEAIRTYVTHNIDTANAAITHYQEQWKQMQGPGLMPGTDHEADAIIESMKYLDPKTGQYHMPKGTDLPVVLRAGVPETAPPPTVLPKPGTQSALPSDLPPSTGHAEGSTAKDASGKVVAVIRNGQWVAP